MQLHELCCPHACMHACMPQAVWYLKCRALTLKNWIDDTEIEEEVRTQPYVCPWQHLTHDPVLWLSCYDGNHGTRGLDC